MIVLFEDEQVVDLYPLSVGKPAYTINCGSYRLLDLASDLAEVFGERVHALVRPHLRDFRQAEPPPEAAARTAACLFINARLVPSLAARQTLKKIVSAGRPGVVAASDEFRPPRENSAARATNANDSDVAAALVPADAVLPPEDAT